PTFPVGPRAAEPPRRYLDVLAREGLLHRVESEAAALEFVEVHVDLDLAGAAAKHLHRANARQDLEALADDVLRDALELVQVLRTGNADRDDGEGARLETRDGGRFRLWRQLVADRVDDALGVHGYEGRIRGTGELDLDERDP